MRREVASCLSRGRVREGHYQTTDGDGLQGAFLLVCPESGRRLRVLASDGRDWPEGGLPLPVWEHVSVSLADESGRPPCWAEMCWVKGLFWEDEEVVLQFHPKTSRYVNIHQGCLHMWRPIGVDIPMPPEVCV